MATDNLKAFVTTAFLLLLLLLFCLLFFTAHIRSPSPSFDLSGLNSILEQQNGSCSIAAPRISQGYINYLHIFHCVSGVHPPVALFCLLANTASRYFCPNSVDRLSRELGLSPAVAGVTPLSLGNGSPDVFARVVSFPSGSGELGLCSVLGGAFFVSCVVLGIVGTCAGPGRACVGRASLVKDVCCFLLVLGSLLVVMVLGRINIWGAIAFTSLYLVYVLIVAVVHCRGSCKYEDLVLVPIKDMDADPDSAIREASRDNEEEHQSSYYTTFRATASYYMGCFFDLVRMPLYLPRRLTIPDVSEERWCRPVAVASATFAPLLVATLWTTKRGRNTGLNTREGFAMFKNAIVVGVFLGSIALKTIKDDWPPRKGLFPWLAGGLLRSVLWTYIIAEELVGLLVSLGHVFGINPSVLGLTVLAWGNSIGDLTANVAMAISGGHDGAQIAVSGCYAGPIFNTLAGLGLSLVVSAWSAHPKPFVIPVGPQLFEISGFMIGGLVWALVMLPKRDMKLDSVVGIGLLAIYSCFLSLRLSQSLGLVQFQFPL